MQCCDRAEVVASTGDRAAGAGAVCTGFCCVSSGVFVCGTMAEGAVDGSIVSLQLVWQGDHSGSVADQC